MILLGLALVAGTAGARPNESRTCGVQLVLPGILRDEPALAEPTVPFDLGPALARGLRLAQFETPELLADLTVGLPEGFALHGGSTIELKRALADGQFRGSVPGSATVAKMISRGNDDEVEALAASRVMSVLTSADIAAEDGDSALIEVPKALAKASAVAARVLGLNRSKSEKFDALSPIFEQLTEPGSPYSSLRRAKSHPSVDLEMRRLIDEYLRYYRDPSPWTLSNATLREGILFVFKSAAVRGKIVMEDPREIGTLVAMTSRQGFALDDLWAIIPLSKYDRSDLAAALPAYDAVFSKRSAARSSAR